MLILWRNFAKPFSENHGGGTPAMRIGCMPHRLSLRRILKERLFPSRIPLPEPWDAYYRGEVDTPGIRNPRRHRLRRAY